MEWLRHPDTCATYSTVDSTATQQPRKTVVLPTALLAEVDPSHLVVDQTRMGTLFGVVRFGEVLLHGLA